MAKTKEQKTQLLESYKGYLSGNPDYFIVDTDRASSEIVKELKKLLTQSGGSFIVLKNTLFKIAAQESQQPSIMQELSDSNGMIVCGKDPSAAAKALKEIQKKFNVLTAKIGVLFGVIAEEELISNLADIPPRETLLAQLMRSMQSPLAGFSRIASGSVRDLTVVLSEYQKKQSSAS